MHSEQTLIEAFRISEARHARLVGAEVTDSELARARISEMLKQSATAPDIQEFQCGAKQDWERVIFCAICKRFGITVYRYSNQRKTTVLVRLSKQFMDDVLWPIYLDVANSVARRFTEVTSGLLPAIASGPFMTAVLEHDHSADVLCEDCQRRLKGEG